MGVFIPSLGGCDITDELQAVVSYVFDVLVQRLRNRLNPLKSLDKSGITLVSGERDALGRHLRSTTFVFKNWRLVFLAWCHKHSQLLHREA